MNPVPVVNVREADIDKILNRGTIVEVLPELGAFKKKLMSGKKLRFYIGFDATAPTLHLSHAKNLILLEKFRKLGHETIVLFGDFTARIGDPSGRSEARNTLTAEVVNENVATWKKLVEPLMDFNDPINPPIIKYNSTWLADRDLKNVSDLAASLTVQQLIERDSFKKRIANDDPLYLHEFLYPLMQGYDSVAMDVDVELCGTDQIFNALVGRTLQKRFNHRDKSVVAVTLMEDPETGELMSKSKGTGVFLHETPEVIFQQVMKQSDSMTKILFVNNTLLEIEEIDEILQLSPADAKARLAFEIVALLSNKDRAEKAKEHFFQDTK
jgi:tyrosyl-tRNA synthetase